MVDFAKKLADWRAQRTPEELARIDAKLAERARIEKATRTIRAEFVRIDRDGTETPREGEVGVLVETREGEADVVRFVGAVTGHEAFALDAALLAELARDAGDPERGRWAICAGTRGRYDRCTVAVADVLTAIEGFRAAIAASAAVPPAKAEDPWGGFDPFRPL